MAQVPILRPRLPLAERLAPYLRRIDETRYYSNFGPLALTLEDRLAEHYGLAGGTVACVANATLGLALTLAAQGVQPGALCALPAWTFVASVHAVVTAGLVPYFVDVSADTWALDPMAVIAAIDGAPAPVGAVMPVAPFGRPLDVAAWDRFRTRTGLPVAIDAAAGFDSLVPGATPAVVSLHATKVIGVGEGGFVTSTDPSIILGVRRRSNFGFAPDRQVVVAATNAKLSEYHAAIGHAALDEWQETRAEWMDVAAAYRGRLAGANQVTLQDEFGESWISATCVVRAADGTAPRIEAALAADGIETRHWWGEGAHAYPAMQDFPRASLATTTELALSTFAVPFYRDLPETDIDRIAAILLKAA
jgi:dTDP-4-amino-4,6-dideoxygalactose transaminase